MISMACELLLAAQYSLLDARCSLLAARCSLPTRLWLFHSGHCCHLGPLPPALSPLPSTVSATCLRTQLFNGVENSIVIGSGYSAATVLSIASSARACT